MDKWVSYQNGNYTVKLNTLNGTKIRFNDLDYFEPDTIESMDIKITNKCDGPKYTSVDDNGNIHECRIPCKMCHEGSCPNGKHGDLTFEGTFLERLHPYTELSLGGGNPLSHPNLEKFLVDCKGHELIPSITIQESEFVDNFDFIKRLYDNKLIYGIGVSLTNYVGTGRQITDTLRSMQLDNLISLIREIPSVVIHTIAGLTPMWQYKYLADSEVKILILGYKTFRRGKDLFDKNEACISESINELKESLGEMITSQWYNTLSFDNLALKQLDVKSHMNEKDWEQFYMGDDGIGNEFDSATMYVDMVERKFAKNSCDPNRYELLPTIEEMYKFLKEGTAR